MTIRRFLGFTYMTGADAKRLRELKRRAMRRAQRRKGRFLTEGEEDRLVGGLLEVMRGRPSGRSRNRGGRKGQVPRHLRRFLFKKRD